MKSVTWDRQQILESVRSDVWRFVSQAARHESELEPEAAALLQMTARDVRELADIQFVLSSEVSELLRTMPSLVRRLATTTVREEEWSVDRVRGPIQWTPTLSGRLTSGLPHLYVTAPARRAFQTPENEILVHALDAVALVGKRTGWSRSSAPEVGRDVRDRVAQAQRWSHTRMLSDIERRVPDERTIARVRSGRARRRYRPTVDVASLHRTLLRRLDRALLRNLIEHHALAARENDVLLELLSAFRIEAAFKKLGWSVSIPGLVRGGMVLLTAQRDEMTATVWYQHAPPGLSGRSVYGDIQRLHGIAVGRLRPDFVVRVTSAGSERWLVVEVKGVQRDVEDSARHAVLDLLAYRRAFGAALDDQTADVYGIGIAWGEQMAPESGSEILLCSPDTVERAFAIALDGTSTSMD